MDVTGIGSVTNSPGGLIEGQMFGVVVQGGGTIDNAGIIRSTGNPNPATPGVSPFGIILTASPDQVGRTATVNNSGTVSGFLGILAGGALDTVIDGETGLFFAQQTADCLADAIRRLDGVDFDPARVHHHAQRFSAARFKEEMGAFVARCWTESTRA